MGFEGADSFWYTLTSPGGVAGTDNAQVTINVGGANGMVWFVKQRRRRHRPPDQSDFPRRPAPINNGTGTNPAAGDTIFLFEGAHALTATLTLLGTQKVIGQDTTATLANLGAPTAQGGNAYPAVNNPTGTAVSITSSAAALTLASGNTLAGFTVGNSTTAVLGTVALGSLSVREVIVSTNGQGIVFTTSATTVDDAHLHRLHVGDVDGRWRWHQLGEHRGHARARHGCNLRQSAAGVSISGGSTATVTYAGTVERNHRRRSVLQ